MDLNPAFWRGRRVLVTGHTGFKGGWLSLWLQSLGAEVSGLALAPPREGFFNAVRLGEVMRSEEGDIRDLARVEDAMRTARPQVIFHLAAQALVRASYKDPVGNYATNVMGTVHVLEAARQVPGVEAIVLVTSDKCYENLEWPWGYRETDPLGGHDPYSSSKGCAEIVAAAYRRSFFAAVPGGPALATARAGNVIGGGDWSEDRLVPDVLRAVAAGHAPEIRNPNATRPWQHVLEPLRGYLLLAQGLAQEDEAARYAEAWNFGPDAAAERTVDWVVRRLLEQVGSTVRWAPAAGGQPHEANLLKLDISKARARLGWHPALAIGEALALTAGWYSQAQAGADMRKFSLEQIAAYAALAAGKQAEGQAA
ncbi:MAG TPA: CDP-glucose 4,6-dehydratase [Burkholderiales bacterium]|jgi:CDP-glucose 4,6-dehydratase